MTTHSTFMAAVHSWIVAVTGFNAQNVIRAQQNAPERAPGVNWATYNYLSGDVRDYPLEKKMDAATPPTLQNVKAIRIHPGTATLSVNVYHTEGVDMLRALDASKTERATRVIFTAAGAVLVGIMGTVRNLTALNETQWVPRFQADFMFNVFHERNELNSIVHETDLNGLVVNDRMETEDVEIYVGREDIPQ